MLQGDTEVLHPLSDGGEQPRPLIAVEGSFGALGHRLEMGEVPDAVRLLLTAPREPLGAPYSRRVSRRR